MVVKQWLEETAPGFHPVETRVGYWPYTLQRVRERNRKKGIGIGLGAGQLRRDGTGGEDDDVVSEMDPDAPGRQGRLLASNDQNFELNLNRTIYEYVRRGEGESAIHLCRECGQPWRAATFRGTLYSTDPFVDGMSDEDNVVAHGNINRELWKAVCYQIAEQEGSDVYERALHAVFAGDVRNALPVCQTWEDHVWVRYNALIESEVDKNLKVVPRVAAGDDETLVTLPSDAPRDPEEIFDILTKSERGEIRAAANEPFHIMQVMIILDRIDELLFKLKSQLELSQVHGSNAPSIPSLPHVLRFAVHLILLLRSVSYPLSVDLHVDMAREHENYIIGKFVELLIASRRDRIIAMYTSHLPSEMQIECYANFLTGVTEDRRTRLEYVQLGHYYGLDMHSVAKRTVDIILREGVMSESLPMNASSVFINLRADDIVLPSDAFQIRALEWLTFEATQYEDALVQANRLLRRFLIFTRINSAKELIAALPEDLILPEWVTHAVSEDHPTTSTTFDEVDDEDAEPEIVIGDEEDRDWFDSSAPSTQGVAQTPSSWWKQKKGGKLMQQSGSASVMMGGKKGMRAKGDVMDGGDERMRRIGEAVKEHLTIRGLLQCLEGYKKWSEGWIRRPMNKDGTEDTTSREYRNWVRKMERLTMTTEKTFREFLGTGWQLRSNKDAASAGSQGDVVDMEQVPDTRDVELQLLREIYIPEVALWLHQILFETREFMEENLDKSLRIADLVANPELEIYRDFKKAGKLNGLLRVLRESAV
ncbi:hypothetical protein HK102_005982, partial [Quaeritorhiza haematococci]